MTDLLNDIIAYVRDMTSYKRPITADTSLDALGVIGDDHDELMAGYGERFHVDMSEYRWYFHTTDEPSVNPGALFFKPPWQRVEHMDITMSMLAEYAKAGAWQLPYPEHSIPPRRYDVLITWVCILLSILTVLILR